MTNSRRLGGVLACVALVLAGCGGGSSNDSLKAEKVIDAFRDAGLRVPNPRDNSKFGLCSATGCTKLITTDAFSVYEWKTDDEATRNADTIAASYPKVVHRNVVIRFATGGSVVEVDPAPYEKILAKL